jgi:hypothetical protein
MSKNRASFAMYGLALASYFSPLMLLAAQAIGRKEDWRMPSSATAAFVHIDAIRAPCNREIEVESNLIKNCGLTFLAAAA